MPYVASKPEIFENTSVGSGECVALVRYATGALATPFWTRGALVKGNATIAKGTAIATFDHDGRYGNHTDGRSHAAIYMGQTTDGIQVIDQWNEHPKGSKRPHMAVARTIAFRGYGREANDGDKFYVVQ